MTETDEETIGEMITRLRSEDNKASNNVADAMERGSIGIAFYADVVDVTTSEALDAVHEDDEVRVEFNKLVGGHDHAFGVALAEHFDHTRVKDGPNGPEVVHVDEDGGESVGIRRKILSWARSIGEVRK